jgi:hypothetical protein
MDQANFVARMAQTTSSVVKIMLIISFAVKMERTTNFVAYRAVDLTAAKMRQIMNSVVKTEPTTNSVAKMEPTILAAVQMSHR